MQQIGEWLEKLGLSEYAQHFADNAIDLSVIRDLTEQDLKDLGVLLGHRRKILRAIAELDGVVPAPIETATELMLRGEAERRHLTLMICDLVGSTALSAPLQSEPGPDTWQQDILVTVAEGLSPQRRRQPRVFVDEFLSDNDNVHDRK